MKIKKIELKGWRSFDYDEGIILDNLKQINIIIGVNNSGKSNLSKYFLMLKEQLKPPEGRAITPDEFTEVRYRIDSSDSWAWLQNEIYCNLEVSSEIPKNAKWGIPKLLKEDHKINLIATHVVKNSNNFFELLYDDKDLSHYDSQAHTGSSITINLEKPFKSSSKKIIKHEDLTICWAYFIESLVFIEPIRHHTRATVLDKHKEFQFDGYNIIMKLKELTEKKKRAVWIEYKQFIKKHLENLLNEQIESIEITDNQTIHFDIFRGNEIISCDLSQVGTGVSQLFMLLSYLFLNKDSSLNVFIDEPEANLHIDSVIKLVEIFEQEFQQHTFFITTHSSSLIDQVKDNWSIHRFNRKGNSPTIVSPCSTIIDKHEILDSLGIKASQLLQSNIIIWVEGPSDRIYIKKWISDLSTNELIEGKHYSFLIYGGANINAHTILREEDNEELIDVFKTSRYSIIVCDSDYKTEFDAKNEKLKNRLQILLNRMGRLEEEININNYIKFWISEGREIENYIPKNLFIKILSKPPFESKRLLIKKQNYPLKTNKSIKEAFGKYEAFDTFFSKMYDFRDKAHGLNIQDYLHRISTKLSNEKVRISKAVVQKWQNSDYENNLDLKTRILEIIDYIKKANGIN